MRWMLLVALLLVSVQAHAQSGDPSGFTDQLNAARASRGLPPVAYDPGAAGVSAQNNSHQLVRGLGHFFTGGFAQCSGFGQHDSATFLASCAGSPSHAAILFSPGLTSVGYHQNGFAHTVSCSASYTASTPSGTATYTVTETYKVRRQLRVFRRGRKGC